VRLWRASRRLVRVRARARARARVRARARARARVGVRARVRARARVGVRVRGRVRVRVRGGRVGAWSGEPGAEDGRGHDRRWRAGRRRRVTAE